MVEILPNPPGLLCSVLSRESGEQLFGTATRVDVWLALEYARPWGADAFSESDLPTLVKEHLSIALDAMPRSRMQFIRQQRVREGLALYIAIARDPEPALYQFRLNDHEELVQIDIPAIASGAEAYEPFRSHESIMLVCTNARRDRCCAKHGLPMYEALAQVGGEAVWQTTHLGGHRFAATAVFLPSGLTYGRLEPADAECVFHENRQGRIMLERFRGRSSYEEPTQAADYFLRRETGGLRVSDFQLLEIQSTEANAWSAAFESASGGTYYVRVSRHNAGTPGSATSSQCTPNQAPKPLQVFRLDGIT
jgi:hypothetical protein